MALAEVHTRTSSSTMPLISRHPQCLQKRRSQANANSWPDASAEKEEIGDVIRTVAQGRNYLPAKLGGKLANFAFRAELTERELDVLRSMCEGKSSKEIGAKLFITEGTVKTHVKSIFYKLDVISRSEAVSTAPSTHGSYRGHGSPTLTPTSSKAAGPLALVVP
jgi:DNA-binding CsgD family transcriptional regulator